MLETIANWHPLLVHFAIAFTIGSVFFDTLDFLRTSSSFERTGFHLMLAAVPCLLAAVLTGNLAEGFLHQPSKHALIEVHKTYANIAVWLFTAAGFWRVFMNFKMQYHGIRKVAYLFIVAAAAMSVFLAAKKGGSIQHDSTPPAKSVVVSRVLLLLALMFAGMVPAAHLQAQGWEWQNPLPHGRTINDILLLPDGRGFACCYDGFFMRSWDGGRTWETRRIIAENLDHVRSTHDGVLVVATDQGRILRSSDGGASWEDPVGMQQGSGTTDLVEARDGTLLALLGGRSLLRTTSDALTWVSAPAPPVRPNESLYSIAQRSSTEWYAASQDRVYHTTTAGAVWDTVSGIQARGLQRLVIADSMTFYQLREGQVLQSLDAGATWRELNVYGFDVHLAIAAGPEMASDLFVLSYGDYTVNKSTDNGATWNISLTGASFPAAYPSSMSFSSRDIGLVAGDGGRILRTEDGGASWSIVHGIGYIAPITGIHFFDSRRGLAYTFDEVLLLTTNSGRRWTETIPAPGWAIRAFGPLSASSGFACAADPRARYAVLYTADAGASWSQRGMLPLYPDPFFAFFPQGIFAFNDSIVWVTGSYGNAYRSRDGGRTFDSLLVSDQLVGQYQTGMSLFHFAPDHYIHVSSAGISHSTDGGDSWQFFRSTMNRSLSRVHFVDSSNGAGLVSGAFAVTGDGGRTWQQTPMNGLSLLHMLEPGTYTAIRMKSKLAPPSGMETSSIVRTSDNGITWDEHLLGERCQWDGWTFTSRDEGWAFGYAGEIRHTTNGGIVAADEARASITPIVTITGVWPQPFVLSRHAGLAITLDANRNSGSLSLEIVDMLGRVIAHRAVTGDAKRYIVFNANDFNPAPATGTYRIVAREGARASVHPLLIID